MKKAQSTVLMIFEVMIVVFVIVSTIKIAQSYASSETADKIIIAEDMRMMINALVATNGDAVVEYPQDVFKYSFRLSQGAISVYTKGEKEQQWISRVFSLPDGYKASGAEFDEGDVCLHKKNKLIILRACG
jgi:hypothetical protein